MAGRDLQVRADLVIPGDEMALSASRSGGPGGQHVNKTSTRVTLRWSVRTSAALDEEARERLLARLASRLTVEGELVVHADESRSQSANREAARERLASLVREALHVPKARRKTRPTLASQRRRMDGKRRRGDTKRLRGPPGDEG